MSQYVTAYGEDIYACDHWGEQEEDAASVLLAQQAGNQNPKQTRKRRCCQCGENYGSAHFSNNRWRKYSYVQVKCLYCQNDLPWDSPRATTLVSSADVLDLPDDVKQSEHSFHYLTISLKHTIEKSYFADLFNFLKITDVHSIRIFSCVPADVFTSFLAENPTLIYLELGGFTVLRSDMEWWCTVLPSIFQTPNLQDLRITNWVSGWGERVQDTFVQQREIYLLPKAVIDSTFWKQAPHKRKYVKTLINMYDWAIRRGVKTIKSAWEILSESIDCLEPTIPRDVCLLILEFSHSASMPLGAKTLCLHVPHDISNGQVLNSVENACKDIKPATILRRRRDWGQTVMYLKVCGEMAEFLLKIGEVPLPWNQEIIVVTETDVVLEH